MDLILIKLIREKKNRCMYVYGMGQRVYLFGGKKIDTPLYVRGFSCQAMYGDWH